jgi:AraC-like DNA-binding protein
VKAFAFHIAAVSTILDRLTRFDDAPSGVGHCLLNGSCAMKIDRLVFSSPGPSAGATEAVRLARWWDEFHASLGGLELTVDPNLPLATSIEYLPLGAFGLGSARGPVNRVYRGEKHAARDGDDRFQLVINRNRTPFGALARSWQDVIPTGSALLRDLTNEADNLCATGYSVNAVFLPRRLLCQALPNAEDLAANVIIPAENEALRLLVYFVDGLLGDEGPSHPAILAQAGWILMDMAVLAFGTDRDNGEIARLRGLRAVRLDAALRMIRAGYDHPGISPAEVADRIGISRRYLQKLLHETGTSFAERVQELRLAKAFALLTGQSAAAYKVSDAAYAAGFNDLSTFNRLFRRKYGLTPTAARGRRDLPSD